MEGWVPIVALLVTALGTLAGALVAIRQAKNQNKQSVDKRLDNYTTRVETRLMDVEGRVEVLEEQGRRDAIWKRVALFYIEALQSFIRRQMPEVAHLMPKVPKELKEDLPHLERNEDEHEGGNTR